MTRFAKRHYEAIAKAMQDARMHLRRDAINQQASVIRALADMMAEDNPRFDRARFERACEPGANVRARTAGKATGRLAALREAAE